MTYQLVKFVDESLLGQRDSFFESLGDKLRLLSIDFWVELP